MGAESDGEPGKGGGQRLRGGRAGYLEPLDHSKDVGFYCE